MLSVSAGAGRTRRVYEQRRADLRARRAGDVRRPGCAVGPGAVRARSRRARSSLRGRLGRRGGAGRIDAVGPIALRAPIQPFQLQEVSPCWPFFPAEAPPAISTPPSPWPTSWSSRGWDVRFAGTPGGVESRLVPAAGIPFTAFEAAGFDRIASGLPREGRGEDQPPPPGKAKKWFADIKPDVVVGFGGVRVHSRWPERPRRPGVPVVLHEQNSVAGMANKYLARRADAVCVTYECSADERWAPPRRSP